MVLVIFRCLNFQYLLQNRTFRFFFYFISIIWWLLNIFRMEHIHLFSLHFIMFFIFRSIKTNKMNGHFSAHDEHHKLKKIEQEKLSDSDFQALPF